MFVICVLALMMISVAYFATGFAAQETSARWIDVDQLDKVIEKQNPVIIDLRTPLEFQHGHIAGAINIPIEALRTDRSAMDAYKNKPLLLYCRTIKKTDLALWLLEGRGFKTIYALKGGYEAYRLRGR